MPSAQPLNVKISLHRQELTDSFDDVGKAARDAAGWHECLDRLGYELDGATPPPWGKRWQVVHPLYVDRLGPEAATIGPPPGWEEYAESHP